MPSKNILITFLFKEAAGPVFTLEMARGLAKNGCNVYAVLSSRISNREAWEKEALFKKVIFIETGTRQTIVQAMVKWYLKDRFVLKKQLSAIRFDKAVSTFYHPWAVDVLNCAPGARKVILCHDPINHSGVSVMERILTTRYIKSGDEVVVLTKSFIPIVKERFGYRDEDIIFMPHGRMQEYKLSDKDCTLLNPDKPINFLFFGRIGLYKGLKVLAAAYKLVSAKHPKCSLKVVGSGSFEEYISDFEGLKNCTVDNRYVADDEIGEYFRTENTVLILPYLDASQSGVIPIALEYGTPIIASNTGGLKEQLNGGQIGLFAVAGDADSLADQMIRVIENRGIMQSQKKMMADYLHSLNWDVVTRSII